MSTRSTIVEESSSFTIHHTTIEDEEDGDIQAVESLNKWKECISEWIVTSTTTEPPSIVIPPRYVFAHNRTQAASKGFPSVLEKGQTMGLTTHETVALYGWTTGDYRFLNPLARRRRWRQEEDKVVVVEFEDYPLLPYDLRKYTFRLFLTDVLPYLRILQSALSKLPPQTSDIIIWRGHVVVVVGSTTSLLLPQSIGSRFILPGYTSATLDRDMAVKFCTSAKKEENDDNDKNSDNYYYYLIGCVSSQTAKSISKWSCRPEEMEVLFGIDTEFEVVPAPSEAEEEDTIHGMPPSSIIRLYVKEVVQQSG